jgi:hypothetical protein
LKPEKPSFVVTTEAKILYCPLPLLARKILLHIYNSQKTLSSLWALLLPYSVVIVEG